jgi:hypothetical protein
MPQTSLIPVKDLILDLSNYRIVPQPNETKAVHALISMKPKWFWALTESLIDDGYLLTENIIVIRSADKSRLIVKEGNRRIGSLKILLGIISKSGLTIPSEIDTKLGKIKKAWRTANASVPCAIYEESEADIVDKIVSLAHAKGELAGRDNWNSVARARHSRDHNGGSEPSLDLLESYLRAGKNLSRESAEIWGGDYKLSVLDECIARIAKRIGLASTKELAKDFPSVPHREKVEKILHDIGTGFLDFPTIRASSDFLANYGLPLPASTSGTSSSASSGASGSTKAGATTGSGGSKASGTTSKGGSTSSKSKAAFAVDDPRAIRAILKAFLPKGKNREKVVTLRDEMLRLTISKNPIAFCFLLRSMFEISVKVYSDENSLPTTRKGKGLAIYDLTLRELLDAASKHLISNSSDKDMNKRLYGASAELSRATGLLSVTSMNQLVHNPLFSVAPGDICRLFCNVFPLLDQMNA